jgi:proliferating cell nuclear antigen
MEGVVMKLVLSEPKYLKDGLSIVSEIVTEGTFKINSDVMELVAMDPANVAMVIFKLPASSFVTYEIDGPTSITLNLNNLKQVLRRTKSSDSLSLEVDENKLKIILESTTKKTFHLPLIDVDDDEQKIPELNFNATITTLSSILNDAIDDVDVVGESVVFNTTKKTFKISSKGDLTKASVDINADGNTKIKSSEDNIKAKYSIEYLKKMIQGSKLSDEVLIQFSKDFPLRLDYQVKDKVSLSFILAPRVDND